MVNRLAIALGALAALAGPARAFDALVCDQPGCLAGAATAPSESLPSGFNTSTTLVVKPAPHCEAGWMLVQPVENHMELCAKDFRAPLR